MLALLQEILEYIATQHKLLQDLNAVTNASQDHFENICTKISACIMQFLELGVLSKQGRQNDNATNKCFVTNHDGYDTVGSALDHDLENYKQYERNSGVDVQQSTLNDSNIDHEIVKLCEDKTRKESENKMKLGNISLNNKKGRLTCTFSSAEESVDLPQNEVYELDQIISEFTKKPHKCQNCPKRFTSNSSLARHQVVHTKERIFQCEICSKSFAYKSALKLHSVIHTNLKPHACDICPQKFARKGDLTQHKRTTHSNNRPFECKICGMRFKRKNALNIHGIVHTRDRPFECNFCDKTFTRKHNFQCHLAIHTGEKSFQCVVCNKKYAHKSSFKKHMRKHAQNTEN